MVVVNPESGSGDHGPQVSMLADEHGFEALETSEPGEAVTLAERAARDASLVAACGGDGTVNEVVRGVQRADALDGTTVGVVPAGTGNNFAGKLGVESIAQSFDVLVAGETRRIDLGVVTAMTRSTAASDSSESSTTAGSTATTAADPSWDGGVELSTDGERPTSSDDLTRPFVNSCVCGITAEASVSTSHDQKDRLGTLAYVFNTLQEAQEFDPIPLHVETGAGPPARSGTAWSGEAVAVLVGNGRRFPAAGSAQADMEDGLLEVTILEDRPTLDLVGEEARRRLLDAEGDHITRLRTASLTLSVRRPEPTAFSLDGEMVEADRLELAVEPRSLGLRVGAGYEPDPDR